MHNKRFYLSHSIIVLFLFWTKVILTSGVNFINVKRTNFSYKCHFGSFYNVHVTIEKLLKWCSYKNFVRLTWNWHLVDIVVKLSLTLEDRVRLFRSCSGTSPHHWWPWPRSNRRPPSSLCWSSRPRHWRRPSCSCSRGLMWPKIQRIILMTMLLIFKFLSVTFIFLITQFLCPNLPV